MRIKYEDEAREDLLAIRRHYQEAGGNSLALRMVCGIRAEVAALADNPHMALTYELVPGLRRLVIAKGAFLVFYRLADIVQVVHVRRAEREPLSSPIP